MKLANKAYSILLGCSILVGGGLFASQKCPVDLSYQPIYDDLWPTDVEAIQHQFAWQEGSGMKELEVVKDFTIPLLPQFEGTEADYRSMVYGYNPDGTLDLVGGAKKSYNENFRRFHLRYHGALEIKFPTGNPQDPVSTQPLYYLFPSAIENVYKHNIPYFVQRGFDVQGADTYQKLSDQFIWTDFAGQGRPYVALRLIWDAKTKACKAKNAIPTYVDLHASANINPRERFVLDSYKTTHSKYQNGYGYPTRIPVTTDYCHFQNVYDTSPIAFYDKKSGVLTVHVPSTDLEDHFLTSRVVDVGNPARNVNFTEHLAGFDGSFKAYGRNKCGKLVPSNLRKATLLAQVSDEVTGRSRVVSNGALQFFEFVNPIRRPVLDQTTVFYTGVVVDAMNGGSKAYDCYALPYPDLNAYVSSLDPLNIPSEIEHAHCFSHGDNPVTNVHEAYSSVSSTTLWDNPAWIFDTLRLPLDVLKGEVSYPENAPTTAIPTNVGAVEAFIGINAHEFVHEAQVASGVLRFLPLEAMAVGIEMDSHAVGDTFAPFRAAAFTQRLTRMLRGDFNAMRPDALGLTTYGMGMWWKWLQDQFDHNNQVMRRTMDVLSSEMIGPLLEANDIPDTLTVNPVSAVGSSAALDRALRDLFNKNIKDVWTDYSISATLLRNNTSIPPQWRTYYPYWMFNTKYNGFNKIFDVTALYGTSQFADWWEKMENNAVIPANYNTPYTGQTFIPTLPNLFETSALSLSTYAFNVTRPSQGGPASIKVTVPTGEWRVALVQFTSDGTQVGSFIADGPHVVSASGTNTITFNVAGHSPAFSDTGNIRLVCVNVTFNGTGQQLSEYYTVETPNASIKIEAP